MRLQKPGFCFAPCKATVLAYKKGFLPPQIRPCFASPALWRAILTALFAVPEAKTAFAAVHPQFGQG